MSRKFVRVLRRVRRIEEHLLNLLSKSTYFTQNSENGKEVTQQPIWSAAALIQIEKLRRTERDDDDDDVELLLLLQQLQCGIKELIMWILFCMQELQEIRWR